MAATKDELGNLRIKLQEARTALASYQHSMEADDPDRANIETAVDMLVQVEEHARQRYQAASEGTTTP